MSSFQRIYVGLLPAWAPEVPDTPLGGRLSPVNGNQRDIDSGSLLQELFGGLESP